MGFLGRLLFLCAAAVAIGVAIFAGITIFAFLLMAGGVAVLAVAGRQFLIEKGILNPRPGVPMDEPEESVTIIEGEFEQIENPMVKEEKKK